MGLRTKALKLKELKSILNNLTDTQLERNIVVIGPYTAGYILNLEISTKDWYPVDPNDPSDLMSEDDMFEIELMVGEKGIPPATVMAGDIILSLVEKK